MVETENKKKKASVYTLQKIYIDEYSHIYKNKQAPFSPSGEAWEETVNYDGKKHLTHLKHRKSKTNPT